MTTRLQVLRSSTTGNLPAAGTRAPGEIFVNFPDLQLGVIDASKNAQKLVAVRFFSATANYAAGDFVIQAGVLYAAKGAITASAFNATQWTQVAASTDANGPYLPIAGGTLAGALILAADPGAALGAATKQYVDGKVTAAPYLPLAGGTMLAPITLSGPPTIPLHAATKAYVDSGAFVPIAGGVMTGDLILNRDAQVPLGAATLEQVNARGAGDNRLINGDMRIDQRGVASGAGGTAAGYTIDRWYYSTSQANKVQWGRGSGAPGGFSYYLNGASLSAYTITASDIFGFYQPIEADMISDFQWGTASAQPVTLSFWAASTLVGTFGGSLRNAVTNRSYPFTYSLPDTAWHKFAITIPGDTAGTWTLSGNGIGVYVNFSLGSGATFSGSSGTWAAANYTSATGAVSVVGTNGASFYVTGVKLEIGSVATPFNRQSLAKSMADCQRYYQTISVSARATATTVDIFTNSASWVTMRATPTTVLVTAGTRANISAATVLSYSTNSGGFTITASGAGSAYALNDLWSLSAEL